MHLAAFAYGLCEVISLCAQQSMRVYVCMCVLLRLNSASVVIVVAGYYTASSVNVEAGEKYTFTL